MTASRYRGSLVVWALLLAYASLYPFHPLRPPPPEVLREFMTATRYMIRSDIAFNVVAYVPLGTLACLYLRGRGSRFPVLGAAAFGAGLSLAMEILQLFVPNRVSSPVDLATNAAGALAGALVFVDPLYSVVTRPLGALREATIIPGAWGDAGLVLAMLWLLAQLNPALPFFGAGDIGGEARVEIEILQYAAVGMSICGFALFVSSIMNGPAGSLRVTLVLLSVALWLKFLAASVLLKPHFSEDWVSMGRIAGLVGGIALFVPLRKLSRFARTYLALLAILAGALVSKIFGAYSPLDEFLRLFQWPHGQLGSFATLTRFLHELWPFAAVVFLVALFLHERRVAPGLK
jgi:VanZ family protein